MFLIAQVQDVLGIDVVPTWTRDAIDACAVQLICHCAVVDAKRHQSGGASRQAAA
jgi:hypothetical protein